MMDKADVIGSACHELSARGPSASAELLRERYPFAPDPIIERKYGPIDATKVFWRDGFVDRYAGCHLIFPPVLRVLSEALGEGFPFHPNWKTDRTHAAYWEVGASVDHLIPVTRGGIDDSSNWVTTSMARNSAKMNWMLDELGWTLHPPGNPQVWDGMMGWFLDYASSHPAVLTNPSIRQWHRAAALIGSTT